MFPEGCCLCGFFLSRQKHRGRETCPGGWTNSCVGAGKGVPVAGQTVDPVSFSQSEHRYIQVHSDGEIYILQETDVTGQRHHLLCQEQDTFGWRGKDVTGNICYKVSLAEDVVGTLSLTYCGTTFIY